MTSLQTGAVPAPGPTASPGIADDELRREAALGGDAALGAPAREAFARLNRVAVETLGVSISLVSLIDADRQVFAGQTGLPQPWAVYGETPLSHSFCQHVVAADAPLVIEDARDHPLVYDNLAIRDLGVIAYAGLPVHLPDGTPLGALCAIDPQPRAWTERELKVLADLAALATHIVYLHTARTAADLDPLTGLPTRASVEALIDAAHADAAGTGTASTVVAIGLNGFKLINQALGRRAGDTVLTVVAQRLAAALRDSDALGRLDGDRFLVLCRGADEQQARDLTQRLIAAIVDQPCPVAGTAQTLSASAGIAVLDGDLAPRDAIDAAMISLGHAKRGTAETPSRQDRRTQAGLALNIRNALVHAHQRGEMHLHYQPIADLATGVPVGVEALLRWEHPAHGAIRPDAFIPVAERSGSIVALGEWILQQACRDLAGWRAALPHLDLAVTVNVAPQQLGVASFPAAVAAALTAADLPPQSLILELTERSLLDDRLGHRLSIDAIHSTGTRFALDDFGTGYSALSYLTQFPIDILKIDRMFVDGLDTDPKARALTRAIVAMAQSLNLTTIAEGIEQPTQLDHLKALGCDMGQGYLLNRPVDPDALLTALTANTPPPDLDPAHPTARRRR